MSNYRTAAAVQSETRTKKVLEGKPTIDVALVVAKTNDVEYAINTSNKIVVESQTETQDPVKLIKLDKLLAQKKKKTIITGNKITITDNVMTFGLILLMQGGTLEKNDEGRLRYTPPKSGEDSNATIFELDTYSAVYNEAGEITEYEVTTYPNCTGEPVSITTEDNTFRLPEYVIDSAPRKGQAPVTFNYVKDLPDFSNAEVTWGGNITIQNAVIDTYRIAEDEENYLPDTI